MLTFTQRSKKEVDYILIGPGDLFTSIIPPLIVPNVKEALRETKGVILYIVNIMTKFGETHNFKAYDFVKKIDEFIGRRVDGVIYNTEKPDEKIMKSYAGKNAEFVEFDEDNEFWKNRNIYAADLIDSSGSIIRHDSGKLALLIKDIISR